MTQELHSADVVTEIRKNQQAYDVIKADMESAYWGKTVLMHDGNVNAIFNDHGDAYMIGCEKFGQGKFSIHQVGQRPVDLGIHSILQSTKS